uniref:G-protein coupled receptors family 1 profile domain-containing protein n=1 Tax=Ascaris lumbricoides TaxID=6252 RepID=A0A0M3HG69_ASCLU
MENEESLLEGFHAVFVIVYLQEIAWIFTPLIISLNVLIHTFLKDMDHGYLDDNFLSSVYIFSEISLRHKEKKGQ